jgi:NAD(P)-dependent dehydrogenase (short-subunit alcohol dehydrogenase family)
MNKVAIITGSSGGIGQALVKTYRNDGYLVMGLDKKPLKNQDSDGFVHLTTNLLSLAKEQEYRDTLVGDIRRHLPDVIDDLVVVNNAAEQILNPVKEIKWDDWERSLGVNAIAPFFLVQSLIDVLTISRGHIINVTSIHAKLTKPNFICYAASKATLEAITRSLAIELSPLGISVNSVAPAAIATDMLMAGFEDKPEKLKRLNECHPVKKIGCPSELAGFIKMITDQKGGFLTGSVLEFNGGIGGVLYDPS